VYNYNATAKYIEMVWMCFKKGQEQLDEQMHYYKMDGVLRPQG